MLARATRIKNRRDESTMSDQETLLGRRQIIYKGGLVVAGVAGTLVLPGCNAITTGPKILETRVDADPQTDAQEVAEEAASQPAQAAGSRKTLTVEHRQSGEKVSVAYKQGANYDRSALEKIYHVMRDRHTDSVTEIDIRLIDLLSDVQATFGHKPMELLSGYRTAETNRRLRRRNRRVARNSYHIRAMAADIRLKDVSNRALKQVAINMERGGVGYYGRSGWIHLDVGPVRTW